jgi:hypothetical protein
MVLWLQPRFLRCDDLFLRMRVHVHPLLLPHLLVEVQLERPHALRRQGDVASHGAVHRRRRDVQFRVRVRLCCGVCVVHAIYV